MTASTGRIFGLYGAGGFAREVMPIARQQLTAAGWKLVFLETVPCRSELNGLPVWSEDEFFAAPASERAYSIAIADGAVRTRLANCCDARGARPISLVAANATIYDANAIGDGAIICANVTVTSNTQIGRHFHANLYSYVAHDCVIGDFVTFAPRVSCNGNVRIGDRAYLGTGALIRPGAAGGAATMIGSDAVVGMGAVVLGNVQAGSTVVGSPAMPLTKKSA